MLPRFALIVATIAALTLSACGANPTAAPPAPQLTATIPQATATPPQPTLCPLATPEPLFVAPVTSPTDLLTQTLAIILGNGEAITVSASAGIFTTTGSFSAAAPQALTIDLVPNASNALTVEGRVRRGENFGCPYGGYTLTTRTDRNGGPLVIEQQSPLAQPTPSTNLPLISTP